MADCWGRLVFIVDGSIISSQRRQVPAYAQSICIDNLGRSVCNSVVTKCGDRDASFLVRHARITPNTLPAKSLQGGLWREPKFLERLLERPSACRKIETYV